MMKNDNDIVREREMQILDKYFPTSSIYSIYNFIRDNKISLDICSARYSKLGDFSTRKNRGLVTYRITINCNLTREFALFVLLHEMAHYKTFVEYGSRVRPHGVEWQKNFAHFINLYRDCLPAEVLPDVELLLASIPLSKQLLSKIEMVLKTYGCQTEALLPVLNDIGENSRFWIDSHSKYVFVKVKRLRTYWICKEVLSGQMFRVHGNTQVHIIE